MQFKKFVDSVEVNDYEVLTDTGWSDIVKIHKTVPYCLWKIKTRDFCLECADTHIVFDDFFNEVYVKDLKVGSAIQTSLGLQTVLYIEKTDIIENMFDLELGVDSNRRYYTNGILSHNTLLMTSLVTDYIKQGYNVLYVSLEMSELRISMRVDANLIQVPIGDFGRRDCDGVPIISTDELMFKFNMMNDDKKLGTLMVKEYGSASINTMHIKALLKELKMVDGFTPDVIVIDYINLMNSSRFTGKNANSYTIVKAIAEELRGMAVEENAVLITATQTNREGIGGDEVSLDKVSESAGLPHTSDFFCGIFQTEQQREHSLFVLKVLKNRYSGYVHKKFAMGINYDYMRFYELSTEEERMIQSKNLDEVNLDDRSSDIDADTTQAFIRKKRWEMTMNYSTLPSKKMFQRKDCVYFPPSHELPDNDMKDWAVYVRIDDTVLRLNHIDNEKGMISFDYVTSTEVLINEDLLGTIFKNVITANEALECKDWLVIKRK